MFNTTKSLQNLKRWTSLTTLICVCVTWSIPLPLVQAQTVLGLPQPGAMVRISPIYNPATISGINVYPDNPLRFDFIINQGDSNLDELAFESESKKLIKYFMAALTIEEDQMWVNLSPYEKDRIIPASFGQTEMGRDLLAQDYLLKQLTASLIYPEDELGKKFWQGVHQKIAERFGTSEIPTETLNKIWIVPDTAKVIEHARGAYIVKSHLKVMLEEDYLALESNKGNTKHGLGDVSSSDLEELNAVSLQMFKEILIPEIEKEINEGKNFSTLRQIYNSVILATWYKQALKEGVLGKVYVDQNKTQGINIEDTQINQKIYAQYLQAFEKGVYNYIREDISTQTQGIIPRKYFSGGANLKVEIETEYASSPAQSEELRINTERSKVVQTDFTAIKGASSLYSTSASSPLSSGESTMVFTSIEQVKQRLIQLGHKDVLTIDFFRLAEFLLDLKDDQATDFVQSEIIGWSLDNLERLIKNVRAMNKELTLPPGVDSEMRTLESILRGLNNDDDNFMLFRDNVAMIEKYRGQMFRNIEDHFMDLGKHGMLPDNILMSEIQELFTDYFYTNDNLRLLLQLSDKSRKFIDTMIERVDVDTMITEEINKREMQERGKSVSIEMLPKRNAPELLVLGSMRILLNEVLRNSDLYGQSLYRVQRTFDDEKSQLKIVIENDGLVPSDPNRMFLWFYSILGLSTKSPLAEDTGRGQGLPRVRKWVSFQGGDIAIYTAVDMRGRDIVRTEIILPILKPIIIVSGQAPENSSSPVQASNPGGIDLNPNELNLQINKKRAGGFNIPIRPQILKQLQGITGFTPNIIQITPAVNSPLLIKEGDTLQLEQLSHL